VAETAVGERIKTLREEKGFTLREMARRTGVSPASLSLLERDRTSPTLATLRKILDALGTSFGTFFAEERSPEGPVFRAQRMRTIRDADRTITFLLPKARGVRIQCAREIFNPHEKPEMETHQFDVGGYLAEGGPILIQIEGRGQWTMGKGDAFYVPAGTKHRAINKGKKRAILFTFYYPPRY